uniref:NADH-ubiquinone oxidoreductase chain 3 n=1 Tax=Azygia robusta TaxID=3062496 RepID=A0AA50W7P5_9TREM|nr:NADH dehydrogenase subunit 3 [Azygia robusta]WMH04202.1 NADH dehydrogenase subunit 3 [Azygia robusta]WMH04214.1 NADH dehydrogenase subunit 3 [Azygia robusta]
MSVFLAGCFVFVFLVGLVGCFHLFCWSFYSDFRLLEVRVWSGSFECGFLSQGCVESFFGGTYFILLVFFVIFDLEVSLLLNMPCQGILFKNLLYYLGFLLVLGLGYGFECSKGYVDWGY